jgi:hypothetical protein
MLRGANEENAVCKLQLVRITCKFSSKAVAYRYYKILQIFDDAKSLNNNPDIFISNNHSTGTKPATMCATNEWHSSINYIFCDQTQ